MMRDVRRRVAALEAAQEAKDGRLIFFRLYGEDGCPLPEAEKSRLLSEAEAEVGPGGWVFGVVRDK